MMSSRSGIALVAGRGIRSRSATRIFSRPRRDLRSPRDVTRKGRVEDRSRRKREMAQLLAAGYGTGAAARLLGVSAPAVSITRSWLEASWRQFQGESKSLSNGHLPRR
jgi:hypothetical protein